MAGELRGVESLGLGIQGHFGVVQGLLGDLRLVLERRQLLFEGIDFRLLGSADRTLASRVLSSRRPS